MFQQSCTVPSKINRFKTCSKHGEKFVTQLESYKNEQEGVYGENKLKNVSKDFHPAVNTKDTAV